MRTDVGLVVAVKDAKGNVVYDANTLYLYGYTCLDQLAFMHRSGMFSRLYQIVIYTVGDRYSMCWGTAVLEAE